MSLNNQGASPTRCAVDGDCPTSLVCIPNTTSWTHGESYCICSPWYAWHLEAPNSTTCVLTGSTIASIVVFAVCGAIILWRMGVLVATIWEAREIKTLRKDVAFTVIFIFCAGWLVCGFLRVIFAGLEFGNPNDQTITPFGPFWKYSPYGVYQTKPLFAAATVFGMLTDYQIIIVWLSVSVSATKYNRQMREKSKCYMQIVVWIIDVSYIIGAGMLIVQEQVSGFLHFSVGYFVLNLLSYALAGWYLHSLLVRALEADKARSNTHMMYVARRIKVIAITNATLILFNIVCALGLAATNANFVELGFVAAGFHDAQIVVMTCQLIVITMYLYNTITSRKRNDANHFSSKKEKLEQGKPDANGVQPQDAGRSFKQWHSNLRHKNALNMLNEVEKQDVPRTPVKRKRSEEVIISATDKVNLHNPVVHFGSDEHTFLSDDPLMVEGLPRTSFSVNFENSSSKVEDGAKLPSNDGNGEVTELTKNSIIHVGDLQDSPSLLVEAQPEMPSATSNKCANLATTPSFDINALINMPPLQQADLPFDANSSASTLATMPSDRSVGYSEKTTAVERDNGPMSAMTPANDDHRLNPPGSAALICQNGIHSRGSTTRTAQNGTPSSSLAIT